MKESGDPGTCANATELQPSYAMAAALPSPRYIWPPRTGRLESRPASESRDASPEPGDESAVPPSAAAPPSAAESEVDPPSAPGGAECSSTAESEPPSGVS